MKPAFRKQLLAEIDKIHVETGSTGPEGYAILRRIANGTDREEMIRGFKLFKESAAKLENEYSSGDREAAFQAIVQHVAMLPDFPIPRWLSAFMEGGAWSFTRYETKTLDEAFRSTRKTGFHVKSAKQRQRISYVVWMVCEEMILSGRGTDDSLFEEVGEKYGIGKTTAKKYFYEVRDREAAHTK